METSALLTPTDRQKRLRDGMLNTLLGVTAVPTILAFWTPWAWVVGWAVLYLAASVYGMVNPFLLPTRVIEQRWTVEVGVLMSFVPVSAAIWSDYRQTRWIVCVIIAIYFALESATLPHLDLPNWRIGPSLLVPVMAVTLFTVDGFGLSDGVIVVAFVAAMFFLIDAGAQSRQRNVEVHNQQRELEEQITKTRHLADHDSLTNVFNRRGITRQIEAAVAGPATLVMFDANRFKSINDTTGHSVGDAVLVQIATQLARRLGGAWEVGRVGGDEFVAVTTGIVELADDLAAPIVCIVNDEPFVHRFEVGVSAGLLATHEETTVDRALAQVGFAMRAAKRNGGGLARFEGNLQRRWERGLEVGGAVSGDDQSNSIIPYGQLIVRDGKAVGCELLARWRCSDGVIRGPGDFLPLLVDKGLMAELNRRMLGEAVRFAARFNDCDQPLFVSVNITANHLAAPDLVSSIVGLLATHQVPHDRLMVEITETESLGRVDWETSVQELREAGILLAIDDLGAGYSSIERMASLPITHLKFDLAFANRVHTPFGEVMRGIVRYAAAAGVEVVAEGIETPAQAASMESIGVEMLQGFLFSRPAPLAQIEATVRSQGRVGAVNAHTPIRSS